MQPLIEISGAGPRYSHARHPAARPSLWFILVICAWWIENWIEIGCAYIAH